MEKIKNVSAEEILDSRGNPTIKVTIATDNFSAIAEVPSGASTGKYEALELRDGDKNRFGGKGVLKAVENINKIIGPAMIGKEPSDQNGIDKKMLELDGTENKTKLGGNAMIGVSMAVARLAAKIIGKPLFKYLEEISGVKPSRKLPYLQANLINGGKHAETPLAFQEYHIIPDTEDLDEALENISKIQSELRKILKANIGDEGGFVPQLDNIEDPLKIFDQAVEGVGLKGKIKYSLDVAASSFYENGKYNIGAEKITADELLALYETLIKKYPIISIEDPFEENDFAMFAKMRETIKNVKIIGDDLTVTNIIRLKEAIDKKSVSGLIIKPNQIGTLTETFETMKMARENDLECIVSHRSGETNDDFIADLAIGTGAFAVKFGALQRGERIAKYNRLKEIFNSK